MILTTPRMTLRPATMADFEAYAACLATDRARYMDGPHDRRTAWNWFCNDRAQWELLGMGGLIMELQGQAIGQVAVCGGPHYPEVELGWFLYDAAHEGKGLAFEAAAAMRDWALGPRGLDTVVSYVDPANTRSARLALRLGATLDPQAATPDDAPTHVYRIRRGQ